MARLSSVLATSFTLLALATTTASAQSPPTVPAAPPPPAAAPPVAAATPPAPPAPTTQQPALAPQSPSPPTQPAPSGPTPLPAPPGGAANWGVPPTGTSWGAAQGAPGYNPYAVPYAPPAGYYAYGYPPAPATPPPTPTRSRSSAAVALGVMGIGVGGIAAIAGLVLFSTGKDAKPVFCDDGSRPFRCADRDNLGRTVSGVVAMIGGVGLVTVGIPLVIYGSKRVPFEPPAKPAENARSPGAARSKGARASLAVRLDPAGAALDARF